MIIHNKYFNAIRAKITFTSLITYKPDKNKLYYTYIYISYKKLSKTVLQIIDY